MCDSQLILRSCMEFFAYVAGFTFFGQILIDFHPVHVPTFAGFYVLSRRGPYPHVCVRNCLQRNVLNSLRQGGIVEVPTLVSVVVFGRAERLASRPAPCGRAFISAVFTWCCTSKRRIFMSSPARRVSSCLLASSCSLASCFGGTLCHILVSCACFGVVTCLRVLSCCGPILQWGLMSWFRVFVSLRLFSWLGDSCLNLGSWLRREAGVICPSSRLRLQKLAQALCLRGTSSRRKLVVSEATAWCQYKCIKNGRGGSAGNNPRLTGPRKGSEQIRRRG